MTILNSKYKKWAPNMFVIDDNRWDFVLSSYNNYNPLLKDDMTVKGLSSYIDFSNDECIGDNNIFSLSDYIWSNGISDGAVLNNVGFTGIDNGLITYEKDRITNKEFIDILVNSKLELQKDDLRLKLHPIKSNSKYFTYPYTFNKNYVSLNGGFFQGFFNLPCKNYSVLPHEVENAWHVEFVLRPQDYIESGNTLNKQKPNNKGIFFYMGTRSENKFLELYNYNLSEYEIRKYDEEFLVCNKFYEGYHFIANENENINDIKNVINTFYCNDYFLDDYIEKETNLNDIQFSTFDGIPLDKRNYYEIKTDNKFLIFSKAKDGFNVDNWSDDYQYILTGETVDNRDNLFLLLNNSKDGYTTKTIDDYYKQKEKGKKYNSKKDIANNAFALKINDNYSISYLYLVENENCELELLTESSLPNLLVPNQWSVINVKIEKNNSSNTIKLYFYIDGYLKFISKELPNFRFRELDENIEKQETIPFSISLGGGTQGLSDSIWVDYYSNFKYILPLEKYFAGTFIGDISSFKFYTEEMEYSQIKNNFLYEKEKLNRQTLLD